MWGCQVRFCSMLGVLIGPCSIPPGFSSIDLSCSISFPSETNRIFGAERCMPASFLLDVVCDVCGIMNCSKHWTTTQFFVPATLMVVTKCCYSLPGLQIISARQTLGTWLYVDQFHNAHLFLIGTQPTSHQGIKHIHTSYCLRHVFSWETSWRSSAITASPEGCSSDDCLCPATLVVIFPCGSLYSPTIWERAAKSMASSLNYWSSLPS